MKTDFEQKIIECFSNMVADFKFNIKRNLNSVFDEIQFENEKCIIRFIYDNGLILCDFIDPIEKIRNENIKRKDGFPSGYPIYPLYSVWKFLYPNDKSDFTYRGREIDDQILAYKRLIVKRFKNVLNGDFSWTTAYKDGDTRLSNKVEYMMTFWEADNPVRIMYREANPEWEEAFDSYKSLLNKLQN